MCVRDYMCVREVRVGLEIFETLESLGHFQTIESLGHFETLESLESLGRVSKVSKTPSTLTESLGFCQSVRRFFPGGFCSPPSILRLHCVIPLRSDFTPSLLFRGVFSWRVLLFGL